MKLEAAVEVYKKLEECSNAPDGAIKEKEELSPEDGEIRRVLRRVGFLRAPTSIRQDVENISRLTAAISNEFPQKAKDALRVFKHHATSVCRNKPECVRCPVNHMCAHVRRPPAITELPADERPRERLLRYGEQGLSDAELLGIIIRAGTPDATAVDLAKTLLSHFGSFRALSNCSTAELCRVPGIGPAKAAQIKAALSIARRFASEKIVPGTKFKGSQDVFNHFRELLRDQKKETFYVVLLDQKHHIIAWRPVSIGTLSQSLVHPREVFAEAIRESAAAVIFVHNHPSGDPKPSSEDIAITKRLKEVGDLVGITVLDHIVIGGDQYVSLAGRNLL